MMTQTQTAHREPTMEEILASIRRIIEDNNATKEDAVMPQPAPNVTENQERTPDINSNIAHFEREFAKADVFSKAVQTNIASHDNYTAYGTQQSHHVNAAYQGHQTAHTNTAPQINNQPQVSAQNFNEANYAQEQAIDPYIKGNRNSVNGFETTDVIVRKSEQPTHLTGLNTIISETASRQVAKSFEHLSAVLMNERNTSVTQITQELVRPLLQDWLDNNLPTLVERLVREEIERVSRGTR
jgi:uncharacterized protein